MRPGPPTRHPSRPSAPTVVRARHAEVASAQPGAQRIGDGQHASGTYTRRSLTVLRTRVCKWLGVPSRGRRARGAVALRWDDGVSRIDCHDTDRRYAALAAAIRDTSGATIVAAHAGVPSLTELPPRDADKWVADNRGDSSIGASRRRDFKRFRQPSRPCREGRTSGISSRSESACGAPCD